METTPQKEVVDCIACDCIAARIRILNRLITSIYDDALRPHGLRVSQMNILVAASKFGLARPAEVCQALAMDPSTLSRNVERMRARGWLEAVDDRDGRASPFRVTKQGERLLGQAFPAWKKAQERAAVVLGEGGAQVLAQAIDNVRRSETQP